MPVGLSLTETIQLRKVNVSGRLAREGGNLHLYARTKNSSDFVRSVEVPTTLVGDIDDSCYRYITQTYDFLADSDLNGTEFQCVATNDKLTSNQSSRSIDMVVDFAQFNTNFHLQNTTWNPAFADKTSPEFKSFTDKIQDETDFVYSQSILKDNYKKSKVTGLEPGSVIVIIAMFIDVELTINDGLDNQITTILTPTDILTAFTDTLPKVAGNLTDNSPLSSLNSATITIIPGPETVYDCVTKTDVVFLLDASGSIGFENFILMKYFIQNYTAGLWLGPDTIQVSVAKYSNYPNNEFWLNEYHGVTGNQSIGKAINDIQYTGGGTYIERGLNFVMNNSLIATNGARDDASKVIILMTDGIAHDNPATAADVLKREGVLIACVAIGNGIKYDQLQSIAYNDTYIFNATDFNVLAGIATTVKGSSCEISNET
ncbi:collagen alpha-4(VI) chain-like isoform X3 [Argopecten irradians]|uniref:collagen alpha-4(VI) chain-like isoform X3 n=1 Tax=Argopecten irradians TaxID=31199 RepID=UPI0037240618